MIKWCFIFSFVWHLLCMVCLSFSLDIDLEQNIHSINFLGSILKEADFFATSSSRSTEIRKNTEDLDIFLLPNSSKSSKLYSREIKKPTPSTDKVAQESQHLEEVYKGIDSQVKHKEEVKQVQPEIPAADWENIRLEIDD